eukprot:EG_transcript_1515
MAGTPAVSSGLSHVLLASSAAEVRRVLTDVGLEVVAEDVAPPPGLDVTSQTALEIAQTLARHKMDVLLGKTHDHPRLATASVSRLVLLAVSQIVFKGDPRPLVAGGRAETVMVVCVVNLANDQGHERKEYVSNMRLQLSLLPSPLAWALQSKKYVTVRDVLLKAEADCAPMVSASALAIQAMAAGLVLDALNDALHSLRLRHKRAPAVVEPLDDWDYGEDEDEDAVEGGHAAVPAAGVAVPRPPSLLEVASSPPAERPKSRSREGSKLADCDAAGLVPATVFCSVNCLATHCASCNAAFEGDVRQMWCPSCYNTICPACCSSPLASFPNSIPTMVCRPCTRLQLRLYKFNHLIVPTDPWARDEALHGGYCDACGALFDFFRRRFYCQQCLRRVCSKCLVGYTSSLLSVAGSSGEVDKSPDKALIEVPSRPKCKECSGKEKPKRQEGVDWSVRTCTLCSTDFTFLVRRHWCRQCHRTICSDCSAYPLSTLQRSHPDCMCISCYRERFSPGRRGVDKSAPSCLLCGSKFTVFWRRHWCRKCGRTICSSCSAVSLSLVSRRHPNCVCKQCFLPSIFLLPEDVGRYILQFLPPRAARACMRAAKRFHRLLSLPFTFVTRLEDYYSIDNDRSLLGEGSFGVVYRCVCKRTGEPRACKVISKSKISTFGVAQLLLNEIRLHSQLDHPNTVPLYETLQSETDIFAVMGVAGDFELVDYVSDKRKVEEAVAANITCQLMNFLSYLHGEKCIVHRDLKPENIMLSSAHTTIKVVDFGLAKYMGPSTKRTGLSPLEHTVLCTPCGTLRYCAPEILAPRAYCERIPYDMVFKRDLYSVGVVLYVMLTGHLPFRSGQLGELHRQMLKGPRFDGPHSSTVPPEARDLIRQLLSINPAARPDPAEALRHPWLVGHAARAGTTQMPKRRTRAPPHEPPLLNVHVDVGPNGSLVADQLQLSAYFGGEALRALEEFVASTPPALGPVTLQQLHEQGYFETEEGKQKLDRLRLINPGLVVTPTGALTPAKPSSGQQTPEASTPTKVPSTEAISQL